MEAVRPRNKGKGKKKSKPTEAKERDKPKQESASTSSGGASVSVLSTSVSTETEQEHTPEVQDRTGQVQEMEKAGVNASATKNNPVENGESENKLRPVSETGYSGLDVATGEEHKPTIPVLMAVSEDLMQLRPESETGQSSLDVAVEENQPVLTAVSEDLIELHTSHHEVEEPVRSKLLKQGKPVLEVVKPELVPVDQVAALAISSQQEIPNEVLTLATEPELKMESDIKCGSRTASNQTTDTRTPANQITAPSAPAELVVTETSQMLTVDTSPPVAIETMGTMYPTLNSLTTEHELMEDLAPFSEEDLSLLYPNRLLESREAFEDCFIRESRQEDHPLYELLSLYLKSRHALVSTQAHLQALKNDYNTHKPLIWNMETRTITSSAKCGDRIKVIHDHSYKMAVFNPEAAVNFNTALTKTRDVLREELCMQSYSSQLARIHVEHYLSQLLKSLPILSQLQQDVGFTSWIPQTPPGSLDSHSSPIRDAISVLFMFERRPHRDRQFTEDCQQWLNMLMSVLLRIATISDHQFIQHHLLRCPPGVSEWGVAYLQVVSPLCTVRVLEAQFGQRDILTGGTPDQSYAYDWGVGMGLHQDWGGPLLDYFVCALATLLLPIKQREEFLVALNVPIATGGDTERRQRWTFVEEDLEEEEEENIMLLKESDFISFFDQFPFSELFQHILQIRADGEIPVAETTSHQMLRLIAFSTCLIRLLGAAFSTLRLARYKEFVKQVGRTIRQAVQYVADQWSLYRAHRLANEDTMSSLPQHGLEGAGRYSLNRLQLEFDQFVLRATCWILTAHRLGAWQFLADMPYNSISLNALWNIFHCIYSNQMMTSDFSGEGGERGGGEGREGARSDPRSQSSSLTTEEILAALKDSTHKAQFTDMLMKTFTSEAVFLLTTFANMARARPSSSEQERQFISTVVLEIFEVTQVTEFSSDVYSRTGSSLLDSIAIVHPFIISLLIGRISEVISHVGENCISVMRELPLNIWTPTSTDLDHAHQWLVGTPVQSATNKLARVMLGELNWGRKTEDGSNDLVLDWWTHRSVALMIVEAHSVLLPWHPGGRDFTSVQSSISKYKNTLQRLTMSQEEKVFVSWAWEVLLMLKLHPNQVIHSSMRMLTPESPTPRDRTVSSVSAKDTSVYRRRSEPEWARLSPDSDDIILPDLTSSSERELAELRDAVRYEGTLAAYVALCLTSLGSDTDHFLLGGLPLLHRLIDEGYFLPALRVVANVTPRFFKHKKILIEATGFLQAVIAVANADSASASLRDRLTFVTPQPLLLRKMAGLLHMQLQTGRGQRGGVSTDVILQFWLNVLLSYPGWHREQSLLYLLNTLCLASFHETAWHQILISALLEAYHALGPLFVKRGILSPVWSIVSASGSPSIFTSVSVKEFPWLAFFSLCAEQEFEEKEGIWKHLLKQLKKDPKISIDNALKKAFTELKTPPGAFSSASLSIYRWAEFCSNMEPGHPIMPLIWQRFFSLYLQRPVLEATMPERGSFGLRFFSQPRANSQRRQMKSCLSAIGMKLQSQIDKQRRDGETEGEVADSETRRDYLLKTLSYFQMLNLWLEEPRLHDPSLYLPGLPPQYGSQRLASVFSPSEFQLWMEFVPLWEVKGQQMELVEEWLQVESYQKMLPSHTPTNTPDDALTRIQKRLKRCKEPVAPPTLQISSRPFEHLTEEILLSRESLLVFLRSDIQFVVQQASAYCTKHNALVTLDTQYMDGIPELYTNEPRQFHVRVPCKSRLRVSHKCFNPATIVFRFDEMQINPKWEQQLAVNRSEYDELVASLSLPLSPDLCKAVVRMEHTVGELSRLSEQLPDTEKARAVQSGVALFYEILDNLNLDCRQFPPSCQFLTSCLQILGQEFIQRDPSQTLRILECLLSHPGKADLLAPLFHPNNCPGQFLEMYGNVEMVARKEGPNMAFSVLTKFSVAQWLGDCSPALPDRNSLLDCVWRGILLCGPKPSIEFEILLETYKHHLRLLVDYHFPELMNDLLSLVVEATDNATITTSIWTSITDILTLNKEHPKECRLGLQQCRDIVSFFSQHYMRKRTVARETLYSLVSWDYVPGVGKHLYLLCYTLVYRWEESVSMGTATHQNAIVECWKGIVDVFAPWVSSVQMSSDTSQPQPPCRDPESGIMGTVMEYFVESVQAAHNRLKDPAQQYSIMALLWEFYCTSLTVPSPPLSILQVYHAHLVNLPWNEYFPDLAATEAMMKLKLMDYYAPSCFVFLGNVFPKIEWKAIVTAYCDVSLHGNPEAPIQLHVMLLQLLVMLAAESDIMQKDTTIPEVMADAQHFHWQFIDSKTYSDILEWQRGHCDSGTVLQTGSCLSLSLRLLKAAAGFPSGDGARQELHPETWQKRYGYVEAVVYLISQASRKKEHQSANYSDVVSHLFQTTLDVYLQDPGQGIENINRLLQIVLSLFNTCSPSAGIRQIILDIVLLILDEMPNVHFLSLPVLSASCHSVVDITTLVKILEKAIQKHFGVLPKPTSEKHELPQDPNGYGWHGVTSYLALPPAKMDEVCHTCLAECAGLVLNGHLLQALPQCSSLQQEFRVAAKTVQWCTQLKPTPMQEAEVFLIWEKTITLLLRQVRFSGNYLEVVPHLTAMATCLTRLGEDKASEGLLGVIGLGKKSSFSYKFRLIARTIAAYLYCQMPVDSSQTTQLRVVPNAPGHVKDPSRSTQKGSLLPNVVTATKLGDSSYHNLESLLTNKHYAHLKDKIRWCLDFVSDPINCVMSTDYLLVDLCTSLYSQHRFLDLLRVSHSSSDVRL